MKQKYMTKKDKELQLRIQVLTLQKEKLIKRYEAKKLRDAFIKKNIKAILSLSIVGWPRTKHMKDYIKWLDLVFEAKIKGVYSIGTTNCDVIIQLHRYAKQLNDTHNPTNKTE